MSNYIYCNGELYHAHKYIKKKKVNGKWRYYYDETANELTMYKKELDKAQEALELGFRNYRHKRFQEDMAWARAHSKELPDAVKNVERYYRDHSRSEGGVKGRKNYEEWKNAYDGGEFLKRDVDYYTNSYDTHKKTVRGKIDSFMSKHGETIAKKLNNTNKKINKAKKWISKLFK